MACVLMQLSHVSIAKYTSRNAVSAEQALWLELMVNVPRDQFRLTDSGDADALPRMGLKVGQLRDRARYLRNVAVKCTALAEKFEERAIDLDLADA